MTRCELVEAKFLRGHLREKPELHVAVADDAWIRSPPRRALAAEVVEDDFLVFLRAVEDAVVDAELRCKRFRSRDVLGFARAEAGVSLAAHVAAFAPELHCDAGDLVPLALQEKCGHCGIDSAGKPDCDLHLFFQCGESPRTFHSGSSPIDLMRRAMHPRQRSEASPMQGFPVYNW